MTQNEYINERMTKSKSLEIIEGYFRDEKKVRETTKRAHAEMRQNVLAAIEKGLVTPEQVPHWV